MKRFVSAVLTTLFLAPAADAKPPVFVTEEGAIRGYDPVAYFTAGEAVKGREEFSSEWQGVHWLLLSAKKPCLIQD